MRGRCYPIKPKQKFGCGTYFWPTKNNKPKNIIHLGRPFFLAENEKQMPQVSHKYQLIQDCCEHFFHILQTISEYYSKYFQKTEADADQNPNRCFAMATTGKFPFRNTISFKSMYNIFFLENGVLQHYYNIILPVTTTSFYAALREAWFPKVCQLIYVLNSS